MLFQSDSLCLRTPSLPSLICSAHSKGRRIIHIAHMIPFWSLVTLNYTLTPFPKTPENSYYIILNKLNSFVQQMHFILCQINSVSVEIICGTKLESEGQVENSTLGHMIVLSPLCCVVFFLLILSLRVKRAASATWPQEAGKSLKFWPMMRAHTQCKHELLMPHHVNSVQCAVWYNMNSQLTASFFCFSVIS